MQERHKTVKSHAFNEDRFVVSKRVFGVIDGATELGGEYDNFKKTPASTLAAFLKKSIEKFPGGDLVDYIKILSQICYKGNLTPASCGIALALMDGNFVTFYALGDCEIIFKTKSGEVKRIKQNGITELDDAAINELKKIAKKSGTSIKSARPFIQELLIKNRNKKNTPGGYDVFEPMQNPSFNPLIEIVGKDVLDKVIICTDGFSQCFTTLKLLDSYENLFDDGVDVISLCDKIKTELKKDTDYDRYPRFKLYDDITVVELTF